MSNYHRMHSGQMYFFTVVTYQRQVFLTTALARQFLRQAFRTVQSTRPFKVTAIVLLPDHLHTIWEMPRGDSNYSIRWSALKSAFTKLWSASQSTLPAIPASRLRRGEKTVWQRRFYEHACRNEEDLKRCVDYIHVNPLKHGLVEHVRNWPWSSFHRYVRAGEYPANWGNVTIADFPECE